MALWEDVVQLVDEPMQGVKLIELVPHADDRGSFTETFNRAKMAALGIDVEFVQDNESVSVHRGTIRGLHLQLPPHAQGKLVRVLRGSITDVAVDLRPASPTYRRSCRVDLRGDDHLAFWIPPGFGHGFCTLEADTVVAYKVTSLYAPDADRSLRWNDPDLAIAWPVGPGDAVLSDKDANAPLLSELEGALHQDDPS